MTNNYTNNGFYHHIHDSLVPLLNQRNLTMYKIRSSKLRQKRLWEQFVLLQHIFLMPSHLQKPDGHLTLPMIYTTCNLTQKLHEKR